MKKVLSIAVLGWFNFLNAGDDRIGEVLIKILHPHKVSLLSTYDVNFLKLFDLLIFTAGTWHPRHHVAKNFKKWYKHIKLPYMAVGLGVENTIDKECFFNYKYFVENASFISVRDRQSAIALGGSDKIKISPDITWFDPFPVCKNYNVNGKILFNIRPQKKAKSIIKNFKKINIDKRYFYSFSPEDYELAKYLNFNKKDIYEFDKARSVKDSKIIFGMRFHSSVFAQQRAIPHFNLIYHEKVSSLSENQKSYINLSTDFATIELLNEFLLKLNNELLIKERELLLSNRKQNLIEINKIKTEFLEAISLIRANEYSKSIKYRLINKLIKCIQ